MDYTYTIVDSDAVSNLQLQTFLDEYGDFTCTGVSRSSDDGLNHILKYAPDLVFVNLNDASSSLFQMVMELYQFLDKIPLVIAISKSKEYAYDAIKNGFFDYWLYPFNEYDIRKSLLKLKKNSPCQKPVETICLQSYKDYQYLNFNDILYLKADNNTTEFFMIDGNVINAYKTLKTFDKALPSNFMRIHQSYIVNTNYVSRINFGKSICSLKTTDLQLPFSRSYKENMTKLKKVLSQSSLSTLN